MTTTDVLVRALDQSGGPVITAGCGPHVPAALPATLTAGRALDSVPPAQALTDHALCGIWASMPEALGSIGLEESGRAARHGSLLALRAWPFPFVAALAVNSGSLGLGDAAFEALYAFVNGQGPTPLGEGLGLEMGIGLEAADQEGPPALRRGSARLAALAEAGWLDSLHLRGSGPTAPGMRLEGLHQPPSVLVAATAGATPADTDSFGFATSDAWHERRKFGDHMDYRATRALEMAVDEYDWTQWLAPDLASPGVAAAFLAKQDPRQGMLALFNRILQPCLAPGGAILFKRFAGAFSSLGNAFAPQINSARLDVLALRGAGVVLAQDLGLRALLGRCLPCNRVEDAPPLDLHGCVAWQDIAARARKGVLLVTTTGRLLDWLWRRASLRFQVKQVASRWVVTLECLDCPLRGIRRLAKADLDGLAFIVPAAAPEVAVEVAGWATPLPVQRSPEPSQPECHVLHLPWARCAWPLP